MDKIDSPVLCGGTFFTLLLEAAKQGLKERKKWGEGKEFTETDVFAALIQVVTDYERPADDKNFRSVVSAYKSCSTKKSGRLPISEQAVITTFNENVLTNYQMSLLKMTALVNIYVDVESKGVWLVRALLDLIRSGIPAGTAFYASEDGSSIGGNALINKTEFYLPALLLGIWHYIVVSRIDNATGRDTYDSWCKPGSSANTREDFESDIGSGTTQQIKLISLDAETCTLDHATIDNATPPEDEPYIDQDDPFIEEPIPEPEPRITNQIINAPAVFFNSGANVMQINNTGTLNIDKGDK